MTSTGKPSALELADGTATRDREQDERVELVGVGSFRADHQDHLAYAASRADARTTFYEDPTHAHRELASPASAPPKCILVDSQLPSAEAFISWIRGEARLFSVPVVAEVSAPTDSAYNWAHAIGADDVIVRGDAGGVTRRLANLGEFDPQRRPPLTQGRAVIAHPEADRRRVLGRILRQAGFDVGFAVDGDELVSTVKGSDASVLLVLTRSLPPDGGDRAIERVREQVAADASPTIVLDAEAGPTGAISGGWGERIAAAGERAPADNLLFLANELLRPDVRDVRASTRVLYSTLCGFRSAGSLEPAFGLTYNVSREGLFVRTLDPPQPGTQLWFEMRPPYGGLAVHLRGRAVWRRGLSNPGGAAPPGFGMRIDSDVCPPGDLDTYREQYSSMLND